MKFDILIIINEDDTVDRFTNIEYDEKECAQAHDIDGLIYGIVIKKGDQNGVRRNI